MEIIIDTSSLLFSVKNKCDIILKVSQQFNNAQIAISDGILRELKGLSSGNSNLSIIAKTTMEILKNKKVKVYNNNEYVDQWIYKHAIENKIKGISQLIITNDTEVYKKIKSEKIAVKKATIKCFLK